MYSLKIFPGGNKSKYITAMKQKYGVFNCLHRKPHTVLTVWEDFKIRLHVVFWCIAWKSDLTPGMLSTSAFSNSKLRTITSDITSDSEFESTNHRFTQREARTCMRPAVPWTPHCYFSGHCCPGWCFSRGCVSYSFLDSPDFHLWALKTLQGHQLVFHLWWREKSDNLITKCLSKIISQVIQYIK